MRVGWISAPLTASTGFSLRKTHEPEMVGLARRFAMDSPTWDTTLST